MAFVATRRALLGGGRRKWTPADWWTVAGQTCVAAYQPIGAPSLAASYVNLAQPGTYDAAPGVAPTFDSATGWTFDGATQYLTTDVIADLGYSFFVRYSNIAYNSTYRFAGSNQSSRHLFYVGAYNNGLLWGYGNNYSTASPYIDNGVIGFAGAATSYFRYHNGVSFGEQTAGTLPFISPGDPIYIGAINYIGEPFGYTAGKIQAIAIYSTTLSASDVAALTARMQAL